MTSCKECKIALRKQWKFCPFCGHKQMSTMGMEELFNEIHEHFKELDKLFGQDYSYDPSGISIKVDRNVGKPSVELDMFGNTSPRLKKALSIPESLLLKKGSVEEPFTSVRRLTQHIIYTIKMPGESAKKDVHIEQFENTTEIKAYSKQKAYFKLLNISLPIANYKVEKDQLIIKFKPLGQ